MIDRLVSGGQTGVDRAALDVALALGLPCGGWCPRGRLAEDGPLDARYPLTETASADPARRTRRNVRDSDGTLIITHGPLTGGTLLTHRLAERAGRPLLVADPGDPGAAKAIRVWLDEHAIRVLNVAGPRESGSPGVYNLAAGLLRAVLAGNHGLTTEGRGGPRRSETCQGQGPQARGPWDEGQGGREG